ncbi:hypothetical protein CVD28_24585 [Bacillus sp. M6-12]|uniref:hypothetical protein n=1 Tax=Bacillus sp. M6-12 TaxID=2054166 RepID=UPI000C76B8EC|nr:hypothetical protein [Bacillus sp. M6-12]PLS15060.1 hypothetical protein CVD28_24585 [Bacillus sp. M6-12]
MKKKFLCLKDWQLNGVVCFYKGKEYEGKFMRNHIREGIHSAKLKGENGIKVDFHSGSDYFRIEE